MTGLPYLATALFLVALDSLESRAKSGRQVVLVSSILMVGLSIFLGLRGFILTDFINYYPLFQSISTDTIDWNSAFEPGFLAFMLLVKVVLGEFVWFTFLSSVLHLAVLAYIFKKYIGSVSLGMLFFLAYRGLFIEFNLSQNFFSILLFALSVPFISSRRPLPFLLLNILGVSFHLSAIAYFPLYFIGNVRLSRMAASTIVFGAFLMSLIGIKIAETLLYIFVSDVGGEFFLQYLYFFDDPSQYILTLGFFERIAVFLLIILFWESILEFVPDGRVLLNISVIYFSSFFAFSSIDVLADRVPLLFVFAIWILLPILTTIEWRFRPYMAAILLPLAFLKIFLSTQDDVASYENHIFGISSFEERKRMVLLHNSK